MKMRRLRKEARKDNDDDQLQNIWIPKWVRQQQQQR